MLQLPEASAGFAGFTVAIRTSFEIVDERSFLKIPLLPLGRHHRARAEVYGALKYVVRLLKPSGLQYAYLPSKYQKVRLFLGHVVCCFGLLLDYI